MNFIKTIANSIYSPSFYKKSISGGVSSAMKYFFLFCLFITALKILVSAFPIITGINVFLNQGVKQVTQTYPNDLVIHIKNGVVSTNVKEPYTIRLPKEWDPRGATVLIDTHTPFSQKTLDANHSFAWLGSDSLFIRQESQGQVRAIDLSKVKNATLSKSEINSFITKISPWFKFVGPVAIIGLTFFLYIVFLSKLIYLFFLALILMLVGKFLSLKLTYWQAYKIGLYCMTLGLLVEFFLLLIPSSFHIHGFPFMFTLISLAIFVINFYNQKTSPKKSPRK